MGYAPGRAAALWVLLVPLSGCGEPSEGAHDAGPSADASLDAASPDAASSADAEPVGPDDAGLPAVVEPGAPCGPDTDCLEESVCVFLDSDHALGVCSPRCEELHTSCGDYGAGVHAECALELEDGGLACGFVCVLDHGDHVHHYECPSGDWGRLRCERTPREHEHRYCAPRQP